MISYISLIGPALLVLTPLSLGILARHHNKFENFFELLYKSVVVIIMPALVFGSVAVERPNILSLGSISALALIGLGATSVISVVATHFAKLNREKSTEIFINATFMNYTFVGLAVVQSVVGTGGVAHASVYAVTAGVIHLSVGLILAKSSAGENISAPKILHDVITFPAAFALIIAMILVVFNVGIPYWDLARTAMNRYSSVASFVMVLAAGYKMRIGHLRDYLSEIISVGTIRLVAGPIITFGTIKIFSVGTEIAQAALLLSVMPPGVFNMILAERFGLNKEVYGSIIFYLTIISLFVGVPLILILAPQFSII